MEIFVRETDEWQAIAVQDIGQRFIAKDELTTSQDTRSRLDWPGDHQKKKSRWSVSAFSGKTNSNVGISFRLLELYCGNFLLRSRDFF